MEFTMETRLSLTLTFTLSSAGMTGVYHQTSSLVLLKVILKIWAYTSELKVFLQVHTSRICLSPVHSEFFTKASRRCGRTLEGQRPHLTGSW